MFNVPPYDKEAIYDAEIAPLMAKIIAICKREEIPCFASFAYAVRPEDTESGTAQLCNTHLPGPGGELFPEYCAFTRQLYDRPRAAAFAITITHSEPTTP